MIAECPGPDCMACTGEVCRLCGAGLGGRDPDVPPCEHDVIERHEYPPVVNRTPIVNALSTAVTENGV